MSRTLPTALGFVFSLGLTIASPAAGQLSRLGAEAGVSRSFPPTGSPDSASTYLEAGADLTLPVGPASIFGTARGGLSMTEEMAGDWVVGSLGVRWMSALPAGLAAGGSVVGQAFHVGEPTLYDALTVRVRPELRWRGAPVTISVRGRGALGRTETATLSTEQGGPPGAPGPSEPSVVTTELSHLGGEARLQVEVGPGRVWLSGRSLDGDVGLYRSAELGVEAPTGPLRWKATAAYWETPSEQELVGGVRVSVPLGGNWFVSSSGRRRAPDPLLATPAAADLSATLRREFSLGGRSRRAVYEIGEQTGGGKRSVVFRLRRPAAEEVEVVGGFSDWRPVPMERTNGVWTSRVPAAPGVYHFGFRVDGEWVVPERAPGLVRDEWGRRNATLVVPESDAQ